jgi:predicted dehydrogenase
LINKLRVGLLGCGDICDIYFKVSKKFEIFDITACASRNIEKARKKAQEYNIPKACSIDELIVDPEIDCILNLTIPEVHAKFNLAALEAGKHVYTEKPLAISIEDGMKTLNLARSKNLRVGCAPDTFLGGRLQACRKAIDEGLIGEPTGASIFFVSHGHEKFHPNPAFYYKPGAGPLLDLGPYYLTALISVLGPVKRCCGFAKATFSERMVETQPRYGEIIKVETPTHICGNLEFENGVIASMVMSFDVWDSELPRLEIYGTKGTLCIKDPDPEDGPNLFGGPLYYKSEKTARWNGKPRPKGLENWELIPVVHGYNENTRGIGLADMAYAIRDGRPHRANGDMAYHVLEIMLGMLESAKEGKFYSLQSRCSKPEPLPVDFPFSE